MYDAISQEEYYRFRAIFEPHQVRIDPVPGQLDPEKDGLPRVYDAALDAPTYFYVDGDERKVDKERRMTPGTPKFLGGGDIKAEPITSARRSLLSVAATIRDRRDAQAHPLGRRCRQGCSVESSATER